MPERSSIKTLFKVVARAIINDPLKARVYNTARINIIIANQAAARAVLVAIIDLPATRLRNGEVHVIAREPEGLYDDIRGAKQYAEAVALIVRSDADDAAGNVALVAGDGEADADVVEEAVLVLLGVAAGEAGEASPAGDGAGEEVVPREAGLQARRAPARDADGLAGGHDAGLARAQDVLDVLSAAADGRADRGEQEQGEGGRHAGGGGGG
ncbi:unnamed protein product [Chondrus crispus]|uniref:Uncharacterized protein n=1 Tax=Chondrus crispus TaxID=2769 RepID=R7Q2A0_CHOCR|nr:unnamed protein product [Chondrus crispus]CDF32722.1 unnamed protein product [Chondrus crispus]|eukprot:XP_005712493.1 unnamed protein product [Chondrus crispus]